MSDDVREQLAAYAHTAWSEYILYMFGKCQANDDGSLIILSGYVAAIRRLASLPYADLSELEKDGDREQADRMLAIIGVLDGD